MLKEKYFYNGISIEPNYNEGWSYDAPKMNDFIMIDEVDGENCFGIDLNTAKFIRDSLNEIITYYDNMPRIGNAVIVIAGIFKDYFGKVTDVDICDSKRPLVIKLEDTSDFNNCTCFVNFDDIKVLK